MPSASGKGVGFEPSGLIGDGRAPVRTNNAVENIQESFAGGVDRNVSQKRVGRAKDIGETEPANWTVSGSARADWGTQIHQSQNREVF